MPSKKKPKKRKPAKSKTTTTNKKKRTTIKKKATKARTSSKSAKNKSSASRKAPRTSVDGTKRKPVRRESDQEVRSRRRSASETVSGAFSGDLQGLSRAEQADSESVEELVEEGNIFEAGAVAGVEESDNAEEKEVHTHELPEDDVPEEYLDKE